MSPEYLFVSIKVFNVYIQISNLGIHLMGTRGTL